MLDFSAVPFVDHHGHPWLRTWRELDVAGFRRCFSESPWSEYAAEHVPRSVPYMRALRMLASILGCECDEAAVLGLRRALPPREYVRRLFSGANVGSLSLDDGYPPPGEALSLDLMSALTGVHASRVLRIETLVEELTPSAPSFAVVVDRFDSIVGDARPAAVALKSIAAYRTGLRLEAASPRDAEGAWDAWRRKAGAAGRARLARKPVVDFFALRAIDHAARQGLAVQFHTGYGDPDLDLREANPLHLRPVIEDARYRGAKLVLLHAAYPYTREAAYLAAVYPHVYLDVSTALPPLGTAELVGAIDQALGVAPASKLLLSTDAARIPEHHALGARLARVSLALALERAVTLGDIRLLDADRIAEWLLWRTAVAVYGQDVGPSPAGAQEGSPAG